MKKEWIESFLLGEAKSLRIEVQQEVSSTNTLLKALAQTGEPEGKVLAACKQNAGKGRLGRQFYSPEDTGLYMSLLLRPKLSVQDSLLITTAAAVAAAEAIEKVTGVSAQIKWVNDIYCHGKKTVGILTESGLEPGSDHIRYAVLGIGFNIWEPEGGFPAELAGIAGSILPAKGEDKHLRSRLAAEVLNGFMKIYPQLTERRFMDQYRSRSMVIGKHVRLITADHTSILESEPVLVVDIGNDAQLIVERPDGTRQSISSGEVSVKL